MSYDEEEDLLRDGFRISDAADGDEADADADLDLDMPDGFDLGDDDSLDDPDDRFS